MSFCYVLRLGGGESKEIGEASMKDRMGAERTLVLACAIASPEGWREDLGSRRTFPQVRRRKPFRSWDVPLPRGGACKKRWTSLTVGGWKQQKPLCLCLCTSQKRLILTGSSGAARFDCAEALAQTPPLRQRSSQHHRTEKTADKKTQDMTPSFALVDICRFVIGQAGGTTWTSDFERAGHPMERLGRSTPAPSLAMEDVTGYDTSKPCFRREKELGSLTPARYSVETSARRLVAVPGAAFCPGEVLCPSIPAEEGPPEACMLQSQSRDEMGCSDSKQTENANVAPDILRMTSDGDDKSHSGIIPVARCNGVDVTKIYKMQGGKVLGTGASGSVKLVEHRQSGQKFAMKTLHMDRFDRNCLMDLKTEIRIMVEVDHPNIIRLQEVYQTADYIYLVLEVCNGGELLNRLNAQKGHHYSERQASKYMREMCQAVRYLHDHNICHRDLKLENFILDSPGDDAQLRLIDFGLSKHLKQSHQHMHRAVGTPFYVAPEVLDFNYTVACDMWSLGVIAYMLLCGRPPFAGETDEDILQKVMKGRYHFPAKVSKKISDHAKDFVASLLRLDPGSRMTAEEALAHPWLHDWDGPAEPIHMDVLEDLAHFQELTEFQRIAKEVIAYTLKPSDVRQLRSEFEKIDQEERGVITFEEVRITRPEATLHVDTHMNAAGRLSEHSEGIGADLIVNCLQMRAALRSFAATSGLTDDAVERIFASVDVRHDGEISWVEFLAATVHISETSEEILRGAFERIKQEEQIEYITPQMVCHLCGLEDSHAEDMFSDCNTAEPGKMTFQEFSSYMRHDAHDEDTRGKKLALMEQSPRNAEQLHAGYFK
eukprot:scaffold3496_cov201-Pinguiococcus_pyrenoidosus.AAC.3